MEHSLHEKLRIYLKNLDGAYAKLVPSKLAGSSKQDIQKLKADFKQVINAFYKQHKMAVELAESVDEMANPNKAGRQHRAMSGGQIIELNYEDDAKVAKEQLLKTKVFDQVRVSRRKFGGKSFYGIYAYFKGDPTIKVWNIDLQFKNGKLVGPRGESLIQHLNKLKIT